MSHTRKVAVVGLGYVGLPVVVALGKIAPTIGFDVSKIRIETLQNGQDTTGEISAESLQEAHLVLSNHSDILKTADFYIITVPTPVDSAKIPDLSFVIKASETVGQYLKKGDIVVYESTVYPGTTEEVGIPVLQKISGLEAGRDFFVGYSPERINPGDTEHSLSKVTKIISAQDETTLQQIASVYGSIVKAGLHPVSSIKVAEAAKVIENTQRDLNVAFMNELAIIFDRMGIDTQEVLKAAQTKWNFMPFQPGLVGGHCIGVDPYYLTYKAEQLGYRPEVILAGRRINDGMGKFIAEKTIKLLIGQGNAIKGARIAVLGLTFKENCADLRNSRVMDVIRELSSYSTQVLVHDPLASPIAAQEEYGVSLLPWEDIHNVDAVVLAVAHQFYRALSLRTLRHCFAKNPLLVDVKSIFSKYDCEQAGIHVWRL
jgi:UDP-N-acetyl-D-galactosamine dehydrogenase